MIWVGQFDSEADFEKYMDQSAFRQWWKDYDEDNTKNFVASSVRSLV